MIYKINYHINLVLFLMQLYITKTDNNKNDNNKRLFCAYYVLEIIFHWLKYFI